jgi:WD40 repeat protein
VDGGAFVYDVASRRRLLTLVPGTAQDPRAEAFYRGVFSPDGRTVAVAGSRGVRFWDSVTGRPRKTVLSGHTSVLRSVAYRRDGQQILTAGADGTVRVWDARTGSPLAVLARHGGPVNDAAFLPDGSIVSGGADHAVRVYRCETCGPADTLLGLAAKQVTRRLSAQERTQFGQ